MPAVQQPFRHFLGSERVYEMITPPSVDMEIARTQPFLTEAELFGHSAARTVLGANAHLHPVQPYPAEAVVDGERHRGGHHPR